MNPASLLFGAPMRILRLAYSGQMSQAPSILRAFILSHYQETLTRGLKSGLTKNDLKSMRENELYFRSPTFRNSLLTKISWSLTGLKMLAWLSFQKSKLSHPLNKILRTLEELPSEHWNPCFLIKKSQCTQTEDRVDPHYELFFHVIPSPYGFNWTSPRKFLWSLRNYLTLKFNHKIGHAMVELKKDGKTVIASGMTGETNSQTIYDLLLRGIGLEILLKNFRGRLECAQFIQADLKKHAAKTHLETLSVPLTPYQFNACIHFLDEWCEYGKYQNYGLCFDSMDQRGASCTSFAISFLELVGQLKPEYERHWKRVLPISNIFFKNPSQKVGLFRMFFFLFFRNQWCRPNETTQVISFWDPDLMYQWIRSYKQQRTSVSESCDSSL